MARESARVVDVIALVLGALLAVACVVFVAAPFLRGNAGDDELVSARSDAARERVRLLEERDRALAALKELEFDHRTGKVSDADYAALLPSLRREAASAIRALERGATAAEPGVRAREADVHA